MRSIGEIFMALDPFKAPLHVEGIGFTGNPLDRADASRADTAKIIALREGPGARFLAMQDLKPALDIGSGKPELLWLATADLPATADLAGAVFLGLQGEIPHFAVAVPTGAALPGRVLDARTAAMQMESDAEMAIIGQARSLLNWHDRHRHCAVCGGSTAMSKAGYARHCTDASCRAEHFPRTDPVVIMLIIDGERCLLGRQPQFPPKFFSALAGFVEPGETLEEAVARETWEEAGIRCGRVRYIASQPWPFPSSLMIGCFAEALTTDIHVDTTELEEAHWFDREAVLAAMRGTGPFNMPPKMAIAHHLVKAWAELG
jgi:NAD+ diphosphatase